MLEFESMNKALKCVWIKRFDEDNKASWNTTDIKINNKPVFFSYLHKKGIYKIKRLLDNTGNFSTFEIGNLLSNFRSKYQGCEPLSRILGAVGVEDCILLLIHYDVLMSH